jgi:ribose transport system permease protein
MSTAGRAPLEADPTPPAGESAAGAADTAQAQRRALRRTLVSSPTYMGAVLVALIVAFTVMRSNAFPTTTNAQNVITDTSTLLVMAVAMTYVMVAGGLDLSIGSVLVFSNVCAAKAMTAMGHGGALTVVVGLLAALGTGMGWGIFNGFCITKLRVPALITTLGSLGAALGAADLLTSGNDVRDVPQTLVNISTSTFLGFSPIVWTAVGVTVVGALVLWLTRFGRHTYIVGSNAEAARRAGINVDRHLMALYALSGLVAGLAGMLALTEFESTTISGHSTDVISVITGVVLGGTSLFGGAGTVIGTVVGIFIPATLNNGLIIAGVQPFWQEVATGLILIAAVYIDQLRRRSRERA